MQPVVADRQGHHPDIEFAREEGGQQPLGPVFHEVQLHARVGLAEPGHGGGEHERGDGRDRPDPQPPAFGRIAHRPLGLPDRGQDCLCPAEQVVPGVGQYHLPPEPVEQPPADPVLGAFEPDHLFAERRLGHAFPLRGPGETARLGDRDEVPELVKFHRNNRLDGSAAIDNPDCSPAAASVKRVG